MTLPPPSELERRARIVALVEAELTSDEAMRWYTFHPKWNKGERLFAARSHEGDHAFLWFGRAGAVVRGYTKGRPVVVAGDLFSGLPARLAAQTREKAFDLDGDSFATWWSGDRWDHAFDPKRGGLGEILGVLDGRAASLVKFARTQHEAKLDAPLLAEIYAGRRITAALARKIVVPRRTEGRVAPIGEAEFKVLRDGETTMLAVGGRVQLEARGKDLYMKALAAVRKILQSSRL